MMLPWLSEGLCPGPAGMAIAPGWLARTEAGDRACGSAAPRRTHPAAPRVGGLRARYGGTFAGHEDGAPRDRGAPSAQADQLPSFTTTRRDGLRDSRGLTLTTYLPRLIAVSGYRGLRGELRIGVGEVSLPLRP